MLMYDSNLVLNGDHYQTTAAEQTGESAIKLSILFGFAIVRAHGFWCKNF